LAKAATDEQHAAVGRQSGGRVFFSCIQMTFGGIARQ